MLRALAAACLAAFLGGCLSIVQVSSQGAPARVGFYPFGVRIERGAADAITVSHTTLGLTDGCGFVALGATHVRCAVIDPKSCGVAVIEQPPKGSTGPLAKVSDEVRAWCLRGKEEVDR